MVLDLLKGKSVLKQDIFQITRDTFVLLKEVVQNDCRPGCRDGEGG